jgi:hypothetical protein
MIKKNYPLKNLEVFILDFQATHNDPKKGIKISSQIKKITGIQVEDYQSALPFRNIRISDP